MFSRVSPVFVLLFGSGLATAGWAAVFPFLYADISSARDLGPGVAAATFTAFAIGSILAAPTAGWLADNYDASRVAILARIGLAAFTALLAVEHRPTGIWLAAAGFGACLAVTQPATNVLLLERTEATRRREVFAWQFVGLNLGTATGAAIGGLLVDLSSQATMRPLYEVATAAALLSAFLVPRSATASPGVRTTRAVETVSYREVLASRQVRWLLAVALLITLACYAQYDSGLPAYLLSATSVTPAQLGAAVAVNAVLVAALTAPVVARTRSTRATSLLTMCAALWVVCWLVFAMPLVISGFDMLFMFAGFAAMSIGETMMAPILSALAATLAPQGAVGRTMAAVTGASTIATAIGPMLAGLLLGAHLSAGFIALQITCCLAAAGAAFALSNRRGADGQVVLTAATTPAR